MSMTPPRPRSVTLGCVYGGLGGVLSALTLIQALSGWGSIEMQETVRSSLDQVGATVSLDTVLPILRGVVTAMLVGAIAAGVFAVYAARGHQASRIGLSVLSGFAAVTFVLAGVAGLLPAVLAALVLYLLWNAPARQWYAAVNGRTPMSLGADPSVARRAATDPGPAMPASTPQPPPYDPTQHAAPAGRPRPVRLALWIAGTGSLFGLASSGLVLLALVVLRDQIVARYDESELLRGQLDAAGMTAEQLVTVGSAVFAGWLVVSLLGVLAVGWAFTGSPAGWWALVVTSVLTAGVAALGLPVGAVWIVGAIIVVVQLSRPEARAWFGRARPRA